MQEDDSLSDYITKVLELVNHMKAYDEEIVDRRIVQKLLISLSREYDSIAEVIEETKDTETIGVQEVIGSLKSHEQRLHSEKLTEKAFSSLSKPKCYKCDKFGHLAKDCSGKAPQAAYYAKHMEEEGTMFYACHAASVLKNMSVWYVDSACSNHMTAHESLLIGIGTNVTAKVKMGNGDLVQVTGKGTLVIDTKSGPRHIKEIM
ncbi:unnamed protein product, partial [Prunus brigantina]